MVQLTDITKSFKVRGGMLEVLRGVNCTLYDGECVVLFGRSGSGKSTLLNIMGMMDTPTSGSYILDGEDITACSGDRLTELRGEKLGFVFQAYNLIPTMTAFENIEMPLGLHGVEKEERRRRVEEALEQVGLSDRRDFRSAELSGGEQQRIAIARAMIMRPSLLLADEPTGNLDSETTHEIMKVLKNTGTTLLIVTHDESLTEYADRVLRLSEGRIV